MLFEHIFNPSTGLKLRIYHHRILQGFADEQTAIDRDSILRESIADPLCNLQVITNNISEFIVLRKFDFHFSQFVHRDAQEFVPVMTRVGAGVCSIAG